MIIGIDGNEANVKMRVGVSVYAFNLINYFKKKANNNLKFVVYLREIPLNNLPKPNNYFRYEIVRGPALWSQLFLPLRLFMKKEIDVFFSPAHYIPRLCPVPIIVTIHDLSYLYFPDDFLKKDLYQLKNWTAYSINKAKKIIAVSKTTKKDILKNYQVPEDKVEVVYNGYEKNVKLKILNFKFQISNYVLYVGTLQPRKNISILINAFAQFIKLYPEFKLVIVGKKGWLYDKIFRQVEDLKLKNKILFTDYVNNQQLAFLYKNAFCFVLPSLYEGFGIPILEAMSYGCPVISSFTSSLPEIGSDASLYFDPKDSNDLLEKLKSIKEDNKLREELIKKGNKRVKEFSWKKCGEETLKIIKSIN